MRPLFFPLIGWLLSVTGCHDPNRPYKTSAGKLTQSEVDEIVKQCGGPPGMATVKDGKVLIYRKDPSIEGCVLKALYATGETTLSDVGNARYEVP